MIPDNGVVNSYSSLTTAELYEEVEKLTLEASHIFRIEDDEKPLQKMSRNEQRFLNFIRRKVN